MTSMPMNAPFSVIYSVCDVNMERDDNQEKGEMEEIKSCENPSSDSTLSTGNEMPYLIYNES